MTFRFLKLALACWFAAVGLASQRALADADVSGLPARPSPDWLRSGTVYEIFPRDFSAAGNLDGVTARLDALHSLGVNILWTMPIHPIGKKFRKGEFGSPYSIADYYAVDSDYGTVADYRRFVSEAHKRDLKVIMDLVVDHTAWDSVMMRHPEFYRHDAKGKIISPVPAWTDVAALNYENPALRQYIIAMLKYWVTNCDVDGFRCDAAAMIPTDFWVQARHELTQIKPDLVLLAEASKPELLTNAFDIDYSWPLLSTVRDVLAQKKPSSSIQRSWEESRAHFPKDSLHLRIVDDHDEDRATMRFGINRTLAASALMFTLDGVPLIYNGMETGDRTASSGDALFDKRTISWQSKENPALPGIYQELVQLRHQYPVLDNSRVEWLHNSSEASLVTFDRADEKDELLVAINFSDRPVTAKIDVKNADGFTPLNFAGLPAFQGGRLPMIRLNQYEWRIFHRSSMVAYPVASLAPAKN